MIQATEHCYIVKDNEILSGEPIIKGTRTPVRAIAIDLAVRSIARRDYPGITSLNIARVFDALSYRARLSE